MTASPDATTAPVVFVGAATLDSIAVVDGYPHRDQRVEAADLVFAGGGPAATAAVAAARLGVAAAFVGTVGADEDGDRIVSGLAAEGVDTRGVTRLAGVRSAASVIVVDRSAGTRAICARPGPALDLRAGLDLIHAAEWVHTDHFGWSAVAAVIDPAATKRPRLSVDAGNPIPDFTPAGIDLYAPTIEALERIHGPAAPDALLDAALHAGARRVVATAGSAGSYAADAPEHGGARASAPAASVEVISTLGAGDVFHGALVAAHVQQQPLADALVYANTVAALSCRGIDGRSAIPSHADVRDHLLASSV